MCLRNLFLFAFFKPAKVKLQRFAAVGAENAARSDNVKINYHSVAAFGTGNFINILLVIAAAVAFIMIVTALAFAVNLFLKLKNGVVQIAHNIRHIVKIAVHILHLICNIVKHIKNSKENLSLLGSLVKL